MNIIRFTGVIPKESRVRAGLKTRGKFVSEETRSKLSTSKSAFYATDEGKVVKARYSINHLGKKMSPETCAKMSKSHKKMWEDPEYKHATILKLHTAGATMKPNKPETILMNLLEKLYPGEWIYNGNNDQDIVINGCVPDFVSTTRMSLCEVFGNFWHSSADRILRVNQTEQGRIQAYKESGYDCLVVWEHELDDLDLVTGKVQTFCACTPKKILGG
ncbi:hypothetical protein IMZ68_00205 [Candidatus Bathyarchaeota archaeon]|nr:hypothetical protein [Candidatus Bathyarchaeota archaeon]